MAKTPTAKKVATAEEPSSTNLKEYAQLYKEAQKSMMDIRKREALMIKLTSLYKEEKMDEKEEKLFRLLMLQDRAKGTLKKDKQYILNQYEYDEAENECYVKNDSAPPVHRLNKETKCRYVYDATLGRQGIAHGAVGRYIVYVPRVITGLEQMSMNEARKMVEGRDYQTPPDKVLIDRIAFAPKEFEKWFGHDDEALLGNKERNQDQDFVF